MPKEKPEIKTDKYVSELLKPSGVGLLSKTAEGMKYYGRKIYDKGIEIIELPEKYMPAFVLGMTDRTKIWVRESLDYFNKIFTIAHEMEYIKDWYERDEDVISRRAASRLGLSYARA
jgi:hypothetical protein